MKRMFLAVILSASLAVSGCSTKWVTVAQADLPIVINLATQIAAMADPNAQKDIQSYGQQAAVDLQLVQTLVDEYNKASAGAKLTTQQKIVTVLTEVSNHLQAILTAVHVFNDVKSQHILEAVNLAILTVNTISALVSGSKTASAAMLPTPLQLEVALLRLQGDA